MKTILITGATDGLGYATAKQLLSLGYQLILHGRNEHKLDALTDEFAQYRDNLSTVVADLSDLRQVSAMVDQLRDEYEHLDVIINNAGVYKTTALSAHPIDIRFVVNTLAPYMLINGLVPIMPPSGRVINLSSAAQALVEYSVLKGEEECADELNLYAQSKLALTSLTLSFAQKYPSGPQFVAINPGSLLATNMVREGFGVSGQDISIGANILVKAAVDDSFAAASGQYYDNDAQCFSAPHAQAADENEQIRLMSILAELVVEHES